MHHDQMQHSTNQPTVKPSHVTIIMSQLRNSDDNPYPLGYSDLLRRIDPHCSLIANLQTNNFSPAHYSGFSNGRAAGQLLACPFHR